MVGLADLHVAHRFLVDVLEARRRHDAVAHGEAQTVRLARAVVRVLPKDHDLEAREAAVAQRREDVLRRRVDDLLAVGASEINTSAPYV